MQYVKNCRVLMHALLVLQGCIPVELQGPARFVKLHSEIMHVTRTSVESTCYEGIRTNKKKICDPYGPYHEHSARQEQEAYFYWP